MKKSLLVLSALLFTLGSCASLPPRTDAQECLIAIKVKFENNTPLSAGQNIQLHFSEDLQPVNLVPADKIYYIRGVKKPGIILTKAVLTMEEGFKGEADKKIIELTLPYEPGTIQLFPMEIRFKQYGYNERTGSYFSVLSLFDLNDQQIEAAWEKIRREENYGTWSSP